MKRNTWQREAVRRAIGETDAFVSAQTLHSRLRSAGSSIGLATVYRTLASLVAEGEVDGLQQDGEQLYRACASAGHHHHLICRRCGAAVEIGAETVEAWARSVAAEHGYTAPSHVVDVFGVCAECTARLG